MVEGLAGRLSTVLGRGAPPLHQVPGEPGVVRLGGLLIILGLLLGDRIPEWIGASTANGTVDRWEGLGIALGVLVGVLVTSCRLGCEADSASPRQRGIAETPTNAPLRLRSIGGNRPDPVRFPVGPRF